MQLNKKNCINQVLPVIPKNRALEYLNESVTAMVKHFFENKKLVASIFICSQKILSAHGVLKVLLLV